MRERIIYLNFQQLTARFLCFVFLFVGYSGPSLADNAKDGLVEAGKKTVAEAETFRSFVHSSPLNQFQENAFKIGNLNFNLFDDSSWYCPVVELPTLQNDFSALNGECLADIPSTGPEDYSQDLSICSCLSSKPSVSVEQTAFQIGRDSEPKLHQNYLTQAAMNENIKRLNGMLEAEQNAMQFQASTLPASNAHVSGLISTFTNRVNFNVSEKLDQVRSQAQGAFNARSDSSAPPQSKLAMLGIDVKPSTGKLLGPPTGQDAVQYDQVNFCLPLRAYMTGKQIPEEPFFEDLQSMGPKFVQSDWDYTQLKREFVTLSADVNTLSEAINRTDSKGIKAKKLYQRIKFLERNPLYRNLFSSTLRSADTKKQELYKMIRGAYGSQVPASERFQKFNKLRYDTGAFFTSSPEMEKIVQNGASENLTRLIQEVPHRVSKISRPFNADLDWVGASILKSSFIGNGRQDPEIYSKYCPRIEFSSKQNQFKVLEDLEEGFNSIYKTNPYENDEFGELNQNFCSTVRKSKDGKQTSTWPDYLEKVCQRKKTNECHPDRHPELIARYVDEYPDPASPSEKAPTTEDLAFLMPFLKGDAYLPGPSNETIKRAVLEGIDPKFTRRQVASTFSDINSGFRENSKIIERTGTLNPIRDVSRPNESSVASSRSSLNAPGTSTSSSSSLQAAPSEASTLAGVLPILGSSAQALRSEVQRTTTEVNDIEKELSSLRNDLTRETTKPESNQNTALIDDLNERIKNASQSLSERTQESAEFQRRLAEIESQEDKTSTKLTKKPRLNNSSTPLASTSAGVQSLNPQTLPNSTQAASSFSPSRLAPQPTSVKSPQTASKTDLLRSKYANGLVSENAITVSNPATASEYQQLAAKASTQGISVQLSTEEFQKLSVSDREKYFTGTDDLVIRMTFSNGVAFVVRNGTGMEIVPIEEGIRRGIASEPESSKPRDKTLEGLQKEFGL